MNLGKKLAEGIAVDTEADEVDVAEIAPDAAVTVAFDIPPRVEVEAPAKPVRV